jgi:predicted ferric reductase
MDKVSFSLDDAKIKLTERSRGRMKIQIKFSKEEAEGFKNFCKIKPEQLDDETFYKQIFFAGCNTMTEQIQKMIQEHQEKQQQETAETTNEQEEE